MKLNILVVVPRLPYPPVWGFGIRVYQIVRYLAKQHDVSLLTYEDAATIGSQASAQNNLEMQRICRNVYTVPTPPQKKRWAQAASLLSRQSFQLRNLHSPAMQKKIQTLLATERFDIIQVESSQMCSFDFGHQSLLLLDEHNLEYELFRRMYETDHGLLRRLYNWAEYVKIRREEQHCWDKADGVILTSEREEETVRRLRPAKSTVTAPNGVDVEYFQPADTPINPSSVVFTGLMTYRPNIDAVIHFVQDILPLIHRVRPEVTFTIVGARPPEEVQELAGPKVIITDFVPDVRTYVHSAAVVVVPLRMGSGTRLKVLEGMAMGKAMVSTSIGCEGIDVQDREHLLIADDPSAFADAVLRILDDAALTITLGQKGRNLAEQAYSWPSVVEKLEGFYGSLLDSSQETTPISTVSALICTRGRGDSLVPTVTSILHPKSTISELLILDQSDDSQTEDALEPFRSDARLRYVRLTTRGKGVSLNYGLREAKGDFVAITDDDCEVGPEWPSHHVNILKKYPRVAVTYGNVVAVKHDATEGFIPDYIVKKDRLIPSIWQKPMARGIGANMAVRRDVVLRMGGFDPECCPGGKFHACVDGDLTARALLTGHQVYEVQKSVVRHYGFRNWEQGRTLTKNAWTGIGAAFAKPLKCGHWDALPVPLYEFIVHAFLPFLWATLTFRNSKGWLRVSYFLKGFIAGWRTPVNRVKMLYLSDADSGRKETSAATMSEASTLSTP